MKHPYPLPMSAAVLVVALTVSLPVVALAREDHGRGGRSSEARGGHAGQRDEFRRGGSRPSGERRDADRGGTRDPSAWRGGGERGPEWRGSRSSGPRSDVRYRDPSAWRGGGERRPEWRGSRSSGPRSDVRYRDPRGDYRADARWRGGRSDVRYRDGNRRTYSPSYRPRSRYGHDGPSYGYYRPRYYYAGSFHRPRFIYRSGFSLGFVIGSVPSYGYRYSDPYCDIGFSSLGAYYDHCYEYGHPEVILVLDSQSGYPIASCVYRGGDWVVDDCY